jgi:hypothetical protein
MCEVVVLRPAGARSRRPLPAPQLFTPAALAVIAARYGPGVWHPSGAAPLTAPGPFSWAGLLGVLSQRRMQRLMLDWAVRTLPLMLLSAVQLLRQRQAARAAAAAARGGSRAAAKCEAAPVPSGSRSSLLLPGASASAARTRRGLGPGAGGSCRAAAAPPAPSPNKAAPGGVGAQAAAVHAPVAGVAAAAEPGAPVERRPLCPGDAGFVDQRGCPSRTPRRAPGGGPRRGGQER